MRRASVTGYGTHFQSDKLSRFGVISRRSAPFVHDRGLLSFCSETLNTKKEDYSQGHQEAVEYQVVQKWGVFYDLGPIKSRNTGEQISVAVENLVYDLVWNYVLRV